MQQHAERAAHVAKDLLDGVHDVVMGGSDGRPVGDSFDPWHEGSFRAESLRVCFCAGASATLARGGGGHLPRWASGTLTSFARLGHRSHRNLRRADATARAITTALTCG